MNLREDNREDRMIAILALIGIVAVIAITVAAVVALLWIAFSFGPGIGALTIVVSALGAVRGWRASL